jgi:hypothetical protein
VRCAPGPSGRGRGSTAEVRPYLAEGLELISEIDDVTAQLYEGNCMMFLAWSSFYEPGGYPVAVRQLTEATVFLQKFKFRFAEALMLETLGRIHLLAGAGAGAWAAAVTVNQRVLELSAGNDELRAEALAGLVAAYRQTGEQQAADDAQREALALLSAMQHPDPERIHARLRSALGTELMVPAGATEAGC